MKKRNPSRTQTIKTPDAVLKSPCAALPFVRAAGYLRLTAVQVLIIALLGVMLYSNTFQVPFIFDDYSNIIKNESIRTIGGVFDDLNHSRFVGKLTFALNYRLNGLDVVGYHVLNLLIHIVNALLVYWLVRLLFATRQISGANPKDKQSGGAGDWVPFLVALLFVSHPVQTQAVTYIVQRYTSLATMFYLLSFALYFKARTSEAPDSRGMHYICWGLSILCAVAAMKTKEIAFTLPLVIVLGDCIFLKGDFKKRLFYLFPFLLTLLIIPLTYADFKGAASGGSGNVIAGIAGVVDYAEKAGFTMSRWDYLITQFRVIVTYLRLMIFPVNQNLDYDYPLYQSLLHPEILPSLLFLVLLGGLAAFFLYRSYRVRTSEGFWQRLFAFGVFWFFITLSVESSVIPLPDFINEHRLYLSSTGFILALVAGLVLIKKRWARRFPGSGRLLVAALLALVLVLSVGTYARNDIWRDEAVFWEDVVQKSPAKLRARYNLAMAYVRQKQSDDAVLRELEAVEKIRPDYEETQHGLGILYKRKGRFEDAVRAFQKAIQQNPRHADAYYDLGLLCQERGNPQEAIRLYQATIRLKPEAVNAHINLGTVYYDLGRYDEALQSWRTALLYAPDDAEIYSNLGALYRKQGRWNDALQAYQKAIELNPDSAYAYYNLGLFYHKQGRLEEAVHAYRQAIDLKPDYPEAHNNLGAAYTTLGRLDDAISEYQTILKIMPNYKQAVQNIQTLHDMKSKRR